MKQMARATSSLLPADLTTFISGMAEHLPHSERDLFHFFVTHVASGMLTRIPFSTAIYCDKEDIFKLYQFFREPLSPEQDGIKIQVRRPQTATTDKKPSSSYLREGTRVQVHLRDTPFLFETLRNYLKQSHLTVYAQTHTTFSVTRNKKGVLTHLEPGGKRSHDELILILIIESIQEETSFQQFNEDLKAVLISVKRSVDDYKAMVTLMQQKAHTLSHKHHSEESRFLRWIIDNNFVFMGIQPFVQNHSKWLKHPDQHPLGVFRESDAQALMDRIMPGMQQEIEQILHALIDTPAENPLSVEYCHHGQSIIYDSQGIDFFTISQSENGEHPKELILVLGRFSRTALATRSSSAPILSDYLNTTLRLSKFPEQSHLHQEFRSLFDRMPIRELFYSDPQTITTQIQEILKIQGDIDVRVMARLGRHGNYVAILTAFSHDRYRAHLDRELAELFSRYLQHPISSTSLSKAGTLFFVVCYATHEPGQPLQFDRDAVEHQVRLLILTWEDGLREALATTLSVREANKRFRCYAPHFQPFYREAIRPSEAVLDIETLKRLQTGKGLEVRIVLHPDHHEAVFIKIYTYNELNLTHVVQTFHHFGIVCLHEISTEIAFSKDNAIKIQRFEIAGTAAEKRQIKARAELFCDALEAIFQNILMDDRLNQLILLQGFSSKEVSLICSLRQYLLQIQPHLAASTVNRILIDHHPITHLILQLFLIRFDPDIEIQHHNRNPRNQILKDLGAAFETALSAVVVLQDDEVLRGLHNLVLSCLRTNYFQKPHQLTALSFKIDSDAIEQMPAPRPWREMYVYGPFLEGIHLRGGQVARGGLRFSDRPEDFRTEILGLMKTQQIKNALIVPVGAKGGFVVRGMDALSPTDQKSWMREQYQLFMRALLDITDNQIEEKIVHPEKTVIYDDDDPYLVVAADKGTTALSDTANQIAQEEYRFWLGDAFASGGSRGYDHKKIGITARGAWACFELHFLELGRHLDEAEERLTVIGIGDMSGDVFGNGMLASEKIQLLGAFNHQHVFLDPNPVPSTSFTERKKLFHQPHSSWSDYDRSLISEGGGVFDRTAKAIPLNAPLRKLLRTKAEKLSGEQVIRRLLTAKVDLLYNGGIGTYVKASDERHTDISDKINDTVRVNADEVRALIVAEGGNLGFTQSARLEYARRGGRINTDAVDNSGGVNLSDHEVNLKILLDDLLQKGEISDIETRHLILERMSEEIAKSVLQDSQRQHLAISRDEIMSAKHPEIYLEALELLINEAELDPITEDIPDHDTLTRWLKKGGLPRPLLAILTGYTKLLIYKQLLDSDAVDLFFFERYLSEYFPRPIAREFSHHLSQHFLKREIIVTTITNRVVHQTCVGPLLNACRRVQSSRVDLAQSPPLPILIKAYFIAENLLTIEDFRKQIIALPDKTLMRQKQQILMQTEEVLLHLASWMIQHMESRRITTDIINLYRKVIQSFRDTLWEVLPQLLLPSNFSALNSLRKKYIETGIPESLATSVALLPLFKNTMTILHIKESLHTRFEEVGHLYIQVNDYFEISWIEEQLTHVRHQDLWGRLTLDNIRKELFETRNRLVMTIITFKRHHETVSEAFSNYLKEVEADNKAYQELVQQLRSHPDEQHDLMPLSVVTRKLQELLLDQ